MSIRSIPLLVGSASVMALPALAATETNPVIVTATRTATHLDTTPVNAIVIDRAQIEHSQARDVGELLRLYAGIDIARNGGPGQSTSFFMRGTESNHTVVMVDGVKINPGTIGQPAIQNIDPDMIDHIEIVKGPRSTLYGSDAVGGVVQIFTRRAQTDRLSGEASVTGGSNNTRKLAAGLGRKTGQWSADLQVSSDRTDGFPSQVGTTLDRGYDNDSVNAHVGYRIGTTDIDLRHWQARGNTEYFDFFLNPLDQDFSNQTTALSVLWPVGDSASSKLTLSQMEDNIEQQQSTDYIKTRRNSLDWQADIEAGRHLLTAGLTLWREHADAISFGSGYHTDTDTNEIYLQDQFNFGSQQLTAGLRHTDHSTAGTETTWNLAYGWQIGSADFVYANAGKAFRAPDATDRFGYGGNPDLKPEIARSVELGWRHHFNDQLQGQLAAFATRINDLIEYDTLTSQIGNIQQARIKGIEANLDYRRGNWNGQLHAILQNPHNRTLDVQLPRRAKRSLTGTLNYQYRKTRLGLEWLLTSQRKDSTFSNTIDGGYGLFNLNGEYRLSPSVSFLGKLENLFDRNYVTASGYVNQGRALYLTLRYRPTP